MIGWLHHIVVVPVTLPLLAGVAMLLLDGRGRAVAATIGVGATGALVATGVVLVYLTGTRELEVYRLGDWPAPFGIVLVADRLAALMVLLTGILVLASLVFSLARWQRAGVHFHPLLQFFLVGLNGAFLTGDLFNLFVFFEVTLAASYGLLLHGSGAKRVKAGLHYIAVNLAASFLFLIGVSLIYGIAGTLNMADLAGFTAQLAASDRALLEAGAGILGVAFLLKAGMWPLNFWLPNTYTAASPPVAAVFAIMTKLGVYVVLRLWLLLFHDAADESARFGASWLVYGGMATIGFGLLGVLASQDNAKLAAYSVLISSGTLLAAIGFGEPAVTAGALFYLISSTLAIGALFLLTELIERGRVIGADMLAVTREAFGDLDEQDTPDDGVGVAVPATMALLGTCFICCAVLLAGLPPLSGFIAKFALLTGLLNPLGLGGGGQPTAPVGWGFMALVILSGLATLIAMTRAGIRSFWPAFERDVPRVSVIELGPVAGLLIVCLSLTLQARPVMAYLDAAAASLHDPGEYRQNVLAEPSGAEQ